MATLYPFPDECPLWLRSWCELNGFTCVEAQHGSGDQWYLFSMGREITINKNIDILVFLRVHGNG